MTHNPVIQAGTRHMELSFHYLYEFVVNRRLLVNHIPTNQQVADILTRTLTTDTFRHHRSSLNLEGSSPSFSFVILYFFLSHHIHEIHLLYLIKKIKISHFSWRHSLHFLEIKRWDGRILVYNIFRLNENICVFSKWVRPINPLYNFFKIIYLTFYKWHKQTPP